MHSMNYHVFSDVNQVVSLFLLSGMLYCPEHHVGFFSGYKKIFS